MDSSTSAGISYLIRLHASEITAAKMDDLTAEGMRRRSTRKATINFLLQTIQRARSTMLSDADALEGYGKYCDSLNEYVRSCQTVIDRQESYIEALKNVAEEDAATIKFQAETIERLERQISNTW